MKSTLKKRSLGAETVMKNPMAYMVLGENDSRLYPVN
jgi:hypothetical protein